MEWDQGLFHTEDFVILPCTAIDLWEDSKLDGVAYRIIFLRDGQGNHNPNEYLKLYPLPDSNLQNGGIYLV